MRTRLVVILLSFAFLFSVDLSAQKNKYKAPKNPEKAAVKKEAQEAKQLEKEMKKVKKAHRKLQGKKTAKRMKKNRKRSTRHAEGKKAPLLQRLFSGKKKKKVKAPKK